MLLLKQDTISKGQVEETKLKLDVGNGEEYKVEAIWDNALYARKLELDYLPGLYYLVL